MKASTCAVIMTAFLTSPACAGWVTQKNEPDPFDSGKSTVIAVNMNGVNGLAIRCIQGEVSLLLMTSAANDVSAGQQVELKMVTDSNPVREEENATVLEANNFSSAIQFGNESTLNYMKGANRISIRYNIDGRIATLTFTGGKSLIDAIARVSKGCGVDGSASTVVTPQATPSANATPLSQTSNNLSLTYSAVVGSKHVFTVAEIQSLTAAYLVEHNCPNNNGAVDRAIVDIARANKDFSNIDSRQAREIADGAAAITSEPVIQEAISKCR